jgi:excisionase family DNA binding protein
VKAARVLDDPFFTVPEVMAATRASYGTVMYWLQTAKLHGVKPGRRVLVRKSELERFLAESSR